MRKTLTGLVLLTFIGGCNTHTEVPVSETYESALARTSALPAVAPESAQESAAIARLQDFLAAFNGRTLVCAESAGRRETLIGQLREFESGSFVDIRQILAPDLYSSLYGK